jgi:nucleoside-diphosphate-sugar epimerase
MSDARGAFNIAAEPVIDGDVLAHLFHARKLRLPRGMVRTLGALSYRLRLQPADPGWIDLALDAPLMDMSRAHRELRWEPRRSATEALMEAFEALHGHATTGTPPLESVQQTM